MKVAVIGTGYVGLTTAVSLAVKGHQVLGIDVVKHKIDRLMQGQSPIYEPGLDQVLKQVLEQENIFFTTRLHEAKEAQVIFVCVGTPEAANGEADLTYLHAALQEIEELHSQAPVERVVVIKSTVPVGTGDHAASRLCHCADLHVVSNPEFLREGCALEDALQPSRIVVGADSQKAMNIMKEMYKGISAPWVETTRANAELIKYASNAFLATRISFMNELARLSSEIGTDVSTISQGMGLDSRIGPQFLRAGVGYGGSCFPKDTIALLNLAKRHGVNLSILEKVREVNATQPLWFLEQLHKQMPDLYGKRIALLGLAFKPDTDDIREAPSLTILDALQRSGALIVAYDPVASNHVKELFPDAEYTSTPEAVFQGAHAALLVTEWKECVELDWAKIMEMMEVPLLFDGRNAWPARALEEAGFFYKGVGRS
ncbi:UDP-glucose/GDP-mannose dehydrogenase family protein [Brevibacillus invocatus]|uniref:UDP-glucose 6-dehydrogenase n=1 Tax=Brevibacillus invocatus TaxID=173959 RepID=A0A3M8CHN1_9BACL|nr:UDP-glucose/GDP-mannose dehydrogenase family protein [Brevibacillus invocatus]RNB75296.1 UDP-glucose/GDP-mannose dehydrogenase family protein [Brevibacillus invocatus]